MSGEKIRVGGFIVLFFCLLTIGCESSEDKELKRLQLEKTRIELQMQTQKLNQEKERAEQEEKQRRVRQEQEEEQRRVRQEQEENSRLALLKAEAERLEREKAQQIAVQQEEERRIRKEQADQFVKLRSEYRMPQIARALMGTSPSIYVVNHDCTQSGGPFTAITKLNYQGYFSGDPFSITGKLVRKSNGDENFYFDPVPAEITGRLALIAQGDQEIVEHIKRLANGTAQFYWKSN